MQKRKHVWMKLAAAAACLCIAVISCIGVSNLYKSENQADAGISIPAVEIPGTAGSAETDMIGLVVYNGNVYTQSESYYGSDALATDHLTGKYLGYATGSIDEFSTDENYEEEFASTIEGKVFEVKGYDADFRICIRNEIEDENGKKQLSIDYLEHLNGIKIKNGSELFEQRLHLSNRADAVKWQNHEDWDNAVGNLHNAQIDNKLWTEFINQINKGEFVDMSSRSPEMFLTKCLICAEETNSGRSIRNHIEIKYKQCQRRYCFNDEGFRQSRETAHSSLSESHHLCYSQYYAYQE